MLDYKILQYKNIITKDNNTYIDLLSKSYDGDLIKTGTFITVNKYYVARPDLISFALYGTDKYADVICKINGISNPFELNENDVLLVPSIEYLENFAKSFDSSGSELINENEDSDEILKIKNTTQKRPNERRSSNNQLVGESSYIIDKTHGIIIY